MPVRPSVLIAAPLLLVADASAQPAQCVAEMGRIGYTDPVSIVEIARDPIPLADGAVLAHEVVEIAPLGWMLPAELSLPAPHALTYPAGTALQPMGMDGDGTQQCLPMAEPGAEALAFAASPLPSGHFVQPCLVDSDGDGRAERVDIMAGNRARHVPTRELLHSIRLAEPVLLIAHPLGLPERRIFLHRRISVAASDGMIRLIIAHAIQEQAGGDRVGQFVARADGRQTFVPVPSPPQSVQMTGNGYVASAYEGRTVLTLVDGATGVVGGLPYRIDRYAEGWRFQPMASRFAPWAFARCDGSGLMLGPRVALDSGGTAR